MAISSVTNGYTLTAVITVTAGTPIFIASGQNPVKASRLFIQMLSGASAQKGLLYDDVPLDELTGAQPAASDVATLCGQPIELEPSTSTAPGTPFEDVPTGDPYNFIDLRNIAIDGLHSGDKVLVKARLKI